MGSEMCIRDRRGTTRGTRSDAHAGRRSITEERRKDVTCRVGAPASSHSTRCVAWAAMLRSGLLRVWRASCASAALRGPYSYTVRQFSSVKMAVDIPQRPTLFIDGEWTSARSGKTRPTINPYDAQVLTEVDEAGAEDAERAIASARKFFDTSDLSLIHI